MWVVLAKDIFSFGDYNKLSARKIGLVEIVEKINSNAYCLKLPSHIQPADVFSVKHFIPFYNSSNEDDGQISRAKFLSPGEDDVEHLILDYLGSIKRANKLSRKGLKRTRACQV